MRDLHFRVTAGNPKVATALMWQTERALRPFDQFLNQAIRTARQRQIRYQLRWDKVGDRQEIDLTPVDSRVAVPRHRWGWRIVDWPPDVLPDPTQKLVVANRGLLVDVVAWDRNPVGGLRIRTAGDLDEADQVWWCGRPCALRQAPASVAPSIVEDTAGVRVELRSPPEADEEAWILTLAGWGGVGHLVVDGTRVEPVELVATAGLRRLTDRAGRTFDRVDGAVHTDHLPADGMLTGDNGVRFHWQPRHRQRGGRGNEAWVQLLPPDDVDTDDFVDPRAAFCEGELEEVWTDARRGRETTFRVRNVDADRYRLHLDRYPPDGSTLLLPVNTHSLELQRRAVRQLTKAPLPHHQGLVRLCERPDKVRWPTFRARWPQRWYILTDRDRDGTDEQRTFVANALGTPDLALLEGPPGSGKTTAICELIWQYAASGRRVLLCASTHVAIDNVLERLAEAGAPVEAVRIGRSDRVDEKVRAAQIDQKVDQLVAAWRSVPRLSTLGDTELRDMAARTVIDAANLTCGTTMGIVHHPVFRDRGQPRRDRDQAITTMPHWDLLIVDEASKTLIQEFLVPALMARRWVVVGDLRQLAPFIDRADIVANLRTLVDANDRPVFPDHHQRARLLLFRLTKPELRRTGARWLIVEPPSVLDRLGDELLHEQNPPTVVRISHRPRDGAGPVREVSVENIRAGDNAALALLACDWVLVPDDILAVVADYLPGDLLHHRDLGSDQRSIPRTHPLWFRRAGWLDHAPRMRTYQVRGAKVTTFAEAESDQQRGLANQDLASEITWRLTRIHELRHSAAGDQRERLTADLNRLLPAAADIADPIAEIQHIGLPSIIEALQDGTGGTARRPSVLTEGMRTDGAAFAARFTSLSYQHRMHPEISDFPREQVYRGQSLKDANTTEARDRTIGWAFAPFGRRRVWIDVPEGRELRGENSREIDVMEGILRQFLAWAAEAGPPDCRPSRPWEVACLSFYLKQEQAISHMLRRVTGDHDRRTRFMARNVELVCAAVDRFQGREADLVLLSMRNTHRIGFLDSPNRLNVAVTRARQQLVVIGRADRFAHCERPELEALVALSHREDAGRWLGGRRR